MKYIAFIILCLLEVMANGQTRTIVPLVRIATTNDSQKTDRYNVALNFGPNKLSFTTSITFNLASVPKGATIQKGILRMVLNSETPSVRVVAKCLGRTDDVTIRSKDTRSYRPNDAIELTAVDPVRFAKVLNDSLNGVTKTITLQLFTQDQGAGFIFYEDRAHYGNTFELSREPRLVIDYIPEMDPVQWAGFGADAQHTSCGVAKFGSGNFPSNLYSKKVVEGIATKSPLLHNDRLFFTESVPGSTLLSSIDPVTGNKRVLNRSLDPQDTIPAISPDGYYYNPTADGIAPISLQDNIAKTKMGERALVPPVLGRDGSVFVCTRSYIQAFSPQPLNILIWKYSTGSVSGNDIAVSPVSLSTDDSFAYAMFGNARSDRKNLVRINVLTKKVDTSSGDIILGESKLPALVVNNNNYVFFANPKQNYLNIYDKSLRLIAQVSYTGQSISQPVASGRYVYVVVENNRVVKFEDDRQVDEMRIGSIGQVKLMGTDMDGNIYILGGQNRFMVCSFSDKKVTPPLTLGSSAFYTMLIARDGSVYLSTDTEIFTVRPDEFKPPLYEVSNAQLANGLTYRGEVLEFKKDERISKSTNNLFIGVNGVYINENVSFENNTIAEVESRGKIIFQKGVSIKKGARIAFKTGY